MRFQVFASGFKQPPKSSSVRRVWQLEDYELAPHGESACELLASTNFEEHTSWDAALWSAQALIEFQDLQYCSVPKVGRFFQVNYLFFEALAALRESFVCGLNGQTHAALAVLRSSAEMFVFHYWWKTKLRASDSYEDFYEWQEGNRRV